MAVSLTRVVGSAVSLPGNARPSVPGGPSVPAVTLGGIAFTGFEAPSRMPFGGEQKLSAHDMPGGARVINAMGGFEADIDFSGTLLGPDAPARARKLDALRKAGGLLTLTWADFTRQVVIRSFSGDYTTRGQLVPYKLVLMVLPPPEPEKAANPADTLGGAMANALGLSSLTPALNTAKALIGKAEQVLPLAGVISPKLAGLAGGVLGQAQGAVSGTLSLADTKISGFMSGGGDLLSLVQNTGSKGLDAASALAMVSGYSRVQAYAGAAQGALGAATGAAKLLAGK